MAAAVHKLFHPHSHDRDSNRDDSKNSDQSPASPHNRQDSGLDKAREDEKRQLAQWEENKHPLSPGQIDSDPNSKVVGHSSSVLRQEDFELIKTLGTGSGTFR